MSVVKLTHKILTTNWPEALAYKILSSINHTRITRTNGPHKLGPKPAHMGRTKITKYQYTNNSYQHYDKIPQILREIKHPDRFKQTEMLLDEQWWPTQQIQHTHCNRNCDPTNRKIRHSSPATGQNHSQPQPHRYHQTPRTQWKNHSDPTNWKCCRATPVTRQESHSRQPSRSSHSHNPTNWKCRHHTPITRYPPPLVIISQLRHHLSI